MAPLDAMQCMHVVCMEVCQGKLNAKVGCSGEHACSWINGRQCVWCSAGLDLQVTCADRFRSMPNGPYLRSFTPPKVTAVPVPMNTEQTPARGGELRDFGCMLTIKTKIMLTDQYRRDRSLQFTLIS